MAFAAARVEPLASSKDFVLPKMADRKETEAAQKLLSHESSNTVALSAIGIGLLSLVTMLGVHLRRGLQPATILASSGRLGPDMSIDTASALGDNAMEMKSQISSDTCTAAVLETRIPCNVNSIRVGWGQLSSPNSLSRTVCSATQGDVNVEVPRCDELPNKVVPWHELAQGFAATAAAVSLTMFSAVPALADNELAEKYGGGLDTSLIDTSCFKPDGACGAAAQSCLKTDNCRRGMTCTAKCLGDNACITGCFAKYGNEPMNDLLECSIERHECIKVAILPAGPDKASEVPMPPLTPVANFNTRSLEGSWYKVMATTIAMTVSIVR
jgi:hypothetical protein